VTLMKGPSIALLALASACAGSPELRWYSECVGPACRPDEGVPCTVHKEGDPCDQLGETCGISGACVGPLVCAASDPKLQPGGCPISSRKFKDGIRYLGQDDLQRLAASVDRIKLATYTYKSDPAARERLGFVIEDDPASPAVADGKTAVDLYAYTSMVVAAMHLQARKNRRAGRRARRAPAAGGFAGEPLCDQPPRRGEQPRARRGIERAMNIDGQTLLLILGLVALMFLLTGPGLWSEKWGWSLSKLFGKKPKR
jgi:hypothetical protein